MYTVQSSPNFFSISEERSKPHGSSVEASLIRAVVQNEPPSQTRKLHFPFSQEINCQVSNWNQIKMESSTIQGEVKVALHFIVLKLRTCIQNEADQKAKQEYEDLMLWEHHQKFPVLFEVIWILSSSDSSLKY